MAQRKLTGAGSRPGRARQFSPEQLEEMVRLYVVERAPLSSLVKRYATDFNLLKRTLISQGVEVRRWSPEQTPALRAQIVKCYVTDGLGMGKLGQQHGIHKKTIRTILVEEGVTIRAEVRDVLNEAQKDEAVRDYHAGIELRVIAKRFDCHRGTVRRALEERGVKARTPAASKVLRDDRANYHHLPRGIYHRRRAGAIASGNGWAITIDDIEAAFSHQQGRCYYTKLPLEWTASYSDYEKRLKNHPCGLSIDRRDTARDYTPDNIVLCCRFANLAKNAWDEATFHDLLKRTAESLSGRDFTEQRARSEESLIA